MYLPSSLFILFLSLNVCTSRPLVAVEEASSTHMINISGKVSDSAKKQLLESNGVTKSEDMKVKNYNIEAVREEISQHKKNVHLKAQESTEQLRDISGLAPIKSPVSVSWSVPHSKQDQNPEFFSDYSRPRTRPPSHN